MKGFCLSPVFQQVLLQVLPGRLTLQLTCFRNSLWRESSLVLTRDKQAEAKPFTLVHGKLFPVSPSPSYLDLRLQLSSCPFRAYALTSSGPPITLIDNHLLIPKTVLDLFRPYLAIKSGHHTGTRTSLCIGLSKSYPLLPDPDSGSKEL